MERGVFLQVIDREWQDYLRAMDDLRHGVNLRAYGQRDPLIEYKKEAFTMFETLMSTIKAKVVSAEFRSATASRMQAMIRLMEQQQAQSNQEDFDGAAPEALKEASKADVEQPAEAPAPTPDSGKTIGDVFASMMSRPAMPVRVPRQMVSPSGEVATIGRNDPCPCGSGKKFKKCCGKDLV